MTGFMISAVRDLLPPGQDKLIWSKAIPQSGENPLARAEAAETEGQEVSRALLAKVISGNKISPISAK